MSDNNFVKTEHPLNIPEKKRSDRRHSERIKYEDKHKYYDDYNYRHDKSRKVRVSESYAFSKDRFIKEETKRDNEAAMASNQKYSSSSYTSHNYAPKHRDRTLIYINEKYLLNDFLQLCSQVQNLGHHINSMASRIYEISIEYSDTDPAAFDVLQPPIFELPLEIDQMLSSNLKSISNVIERLVLRLPIAPNIFATMIAIWHFRKSALPGNISLADLNSLKTKSFLESIDDVNLRKIRKTKKSWWLAHTTSYFIINSIHNKIERLLLNGQWMEAGLGIQFFCELVNLNIIDLSSLLFLIQQLLELILTCQNVYHTKFMLYNILRVLPKIQHPKFFDMLTANDSFKLLRIIVFSLVDEESLDKFANEDDLNVINDEFDSVSQLKKVLSNKSIYDELTICPLTNLDDDMYITKNCSLQKCLSAIKALSKIQWKARFNFHVYHHEQLVSLLDEQPHAVQHHLRLISIGSVYSLIDGIDKQLMFQRHIYLTGEASGAPKETLENVSVGRNAVYQHYHVKLFSDEIIRQQLPGVLPLLEHDYWQVEEEILSTLHAFRHSIDLCSTALLKINIQHDQFDLILVEILLNEMLIIPYSAEYPKFYCLLLEKMTNLQSTLISFINIAIRRLSDLCDYLDIQVIDKLSTFMSYWISCQKSPIVCFNTILDNFNYNVGNHMKLEYFLRLMFQKLSHYMYLSEAEIDLYSEWSRGLIPSSKIQIDCSLNNLISDYQMQLNQCLNTIEKIDDENKRNDENSQQSEQELTLEQLRKPPIYPLEYVFLRRLIVSKLRSETQKRAAKHIISTVIFSVLAKNKRLSELPENSFFEKLTNPEIYLRLNNFIKPDVDLEGEDTFIEKPETEESENFDAVLSEITQYSYKFDQSSENWLLNDLLQLTTKVFLGHGSKSIYHFYRVIELYHDIFLQFKLQYESDETENYNKIILNTAYNCWKNCPKRLTTVLEILVRRNIITDFSLQSFIIEHFSIVSLTEYVVFDLLLLLLRSSLTKLYQARKSAHLIKKDEFVGEMLEENSLQKASLDVPDERHNNLLIQGLTTLCQRYDLEVQEHSNEFFNNLMEGFIMLYGKIHLYYMDNSFFTDHTFSNKSQNLLDKLNNIKTYFYPSQIDRIVKN